jgi:hypothetical protein
VLSGSDDGTLRVWKNANLVASEKEGLRADTERRAEEEQQSKRRAKEVCFASAEVQILTQTFTCLLVQKYKYGGRGGAAVEAPRERRRCEIFLLYLFYYLLTSTQVQIRRERRSSSPSAARKEEVRNLLALLVLLVQKIKNWRILKAPREGGTRFTSFTSTKVQRLTQRYEIYLLY